METLGELEWPMSLTRESIPHGSVHAITWVHGLSGYDKVSSHCMVESMLSALQRVLAKPKNKKEPITIEMLQSLAAKYKDKSSISDLRLMAMCLVGFACFLRFSELCSIRTRDVKFNTTYCSIFIESSKTDQLREGAWVNIARTDRDTCPVTALQRYVSVAGLILDDDLPLFRALGPSKTSRVRQQGISYTRARELVKEAFKDITDVSKISLHSLRSGGASAAANAGIPDRLFKRHGKWTSKNAKDGYVKDNLQGILSVSKSLGL